MKRVLVTLLFLQWLAPGHAQTVLNVRAFEEDGTIEVLYDLYTTKEEKEFFVKLKVSKDGGKNYTSVYETVGDANKNVKSGPEHFIIWNPQPLPGDSLLFKVEAEPKRSSEQMGNPNADKFVTSKSGHLTIARVVRFNSDIEFTFSFTNTREQNNEMFIAAAFNFKDEKNKTYTSATVLQDGKPGSAISCRQTKGTTFKVRVPDVPETIRLFTNVEFSLSEIHVAFTNVKIEQ